ncbi:ABC transporter substrate-binding protein [Frankia sp. QA3]|uniref:ABC transporter substrate-binding protein n=1 Tax=Frankia sp. QA3 TaxID=710111 RepID=UPI000269BDFB|nr:ABC transporter substrate-binding protein [Frankia sp. QA3]EIV92840.1 ABC-type branched-chain amino acid transport system, periplasmic component [Frankia sp. QA3]
MNARVRTAVALVAACTAALAACSTNPDSGDGTGAGGGVKTGNGVTDTTITIGSLTDLSGPFAAGAAVQTAEFKAYWASVNADGGVCGRQVKLDVRDHGYDPQKAVSLYRSMATNVVGLQQVLGSPVVAAVLPLADDDGLYVGGMGWPSVALGYEVAQIPGTTYSLEGANAVDFLVDELHLPKGSTIGHVYFVGDYGSDALRGSQHAAQERGVKIFPQEITPRDTDLSAQAAALRQAGVSAVLVSTAPTQLGSLSGVLDSLGVDVPIVGNTPAFNPALLKTSAGPALNANGYSITAIAPFSHDAPGVRKAVELYQAAAPNGADGWEVPLAYGQGVLLRDALDRACDAGDLTPEGLVKAMHSASGIDADGVFPGKLDFTKAGQPATRSVFVSKVDRQVPGGLRLLTTMTGPSASSYPVAD